jgi:3-oxoacyl-[acyl-carrier-protein] synthase III
VSFESHSPVPLDILGLSSLVPEGRLPLAKVLECEKPFYDEQIAALSDPFRARLLDGLGIESVATFGSLSSKDAAERVARQALDRASLAPKDLDLIIDYSTLATDCPRIWSLAHYLQGRFEASNALALGAYGSGCAGLHLALLLAKNLFVAQPNLDYALLVAADRAPDGGRCCLPVSIMADAATALVIGRAKNSERHFGRIHSVQTQQIGGFSDLLVVDPSPCRMRIDAAAFERQVLPVHFFMLNRLISRVLRVTGIDSTKLSTYVYPNTTALDRQSLARSLRVEDANFLGPGPSHLGHAFANDLVINAENYLLSAKDGPSSYGAWLAAGSGFTWGAAIVEVGA